jgi:UDP-N-acetylmuramoylalanine--D-glutamate ligase
MMKVKDKKISIIGAERSGVGAAKLIKKLGGIPFVSDSGSKDKLADSIKKFKPENIEFETNEHTDRVYDCELMVVSPGVPSDAVIIKKAVAAGIKVISEIELAYHFCKGKIIAITGTNGKTTTTALCGYVLNQCGIKAYVAGNIGLAFSEIVLDVKENEIAVLEVSSFQLDFIDKFKPMIAVILNITPDHLNRYQNKLENYIGSKLNIYKNQDDRDSLILNKDNERLIDSLTFYKSKPYYFSLTEPQITGCYLSGDQIMYNENGELIFTCRVGDINLLGEHNTANAMAVITAAKILQCDNDNIINALKSFKGVEHRIELVREIDGILYVNDSKATNVDSVWYALKSFNQPIFLILGGQDKGNDYEKIKEIVEEKVKKIFAIGSSAEKIFNFFHSIVKVEIKKTIQEVILSVNKEARRGDIVLLSPACASFDMFENFEHRGNVFKEAVNNL